MNLSDIMAFLGYILKPFRKKSNEIPKSASSSVHGGEEFTVVEHEEEPAEAESDIKAHLLLRLLGGEEYGSVTPSCEMDSELWSMLPNELLPRVLLFLPLISKLRLRAVCREWQDLLASSSSELDTKDSRGLLHPPSTPLVCAYRFIHGNWCRDRGVHVTNASVSLESLHLQRKLKCREVLMLFPDIDPPDSRGQGCRIDAKIRPEDGTLSVDIWKERQLLTGNLRRHRGVPTVLDLFSFLVNPITETVLPLPQLRTEGDHSLGKNLGLVCTKSVAKKGLFDTFSFYWTSWWLDVGIGLRENTSWFFRSRRHPIEVARYPESVNVRDRSGEMNLLGVTMTEFIAGKFQTVISDGMVFGVHYLPDGTNRLFTRAVSPAAQLKQLTLWHEAAQVPKVYDVLDQRYFLVEHRASQSVYFVGHYSVKSGNHVFRVCRLQSDCFPTWFWLPLLDMPSTHVDDVRARLGTEIALLDRTFLAGDSIILVLRSAPPTTKVLFVAFDIYDETWQIVFTGEDPEEVAEFDGFFEVRPDLLFPHGIGEGMKLY